MSLVLVVQAVALLFSPSLVTTRPARFYAWTWYTIWMSGCCLTLLIGMHYNELISQYSWAFLWLPPIATIATAVLTHRTSQQARASSCPASSDVEADPASAAATRPVACSKAAWCKCWVEFWAFCGWSSMFWLAFLVSWFMPYSVLHKASGPCRTDTVCMCLYNAGSVWRLAIMACVLSSP